MVKAAKYNVAISTACPGLDYIVLETTGAAQACDELLRRENLGVATFMIDEIARCSEKAYDYLLINDGRQILLFSSNQELLDYIKEASPSLNLAMAATTAREADLAFSGIYPPCEGHGITGACPKCRYSKYDQDGELFHKELSPSDVQQKGSYRLYLQKTHAAKFCPPVFGHLKSHPVIVYDVHMKKRWPMRFRSSGGKNYLTSGWSRFAEEKKLNEDDKITFYELNPKTETGTRIKVFVIGVKHKGCIQIFGAPIN